MWVSVTLSAPNISARTVELLGATNFEAGVSSVWFANTLKGTKAAGVIEGSFPHSGTWYGYVGNETNSIGSLYQIMWVPPGAGVASITFYCNVGSSETATVSKFDVMDINLRTYSPDTLIKKIATLSNLEKATDGAYSKLIFTYDLSAYQSEFVILQFYATNDYSNPTVFRIDDVSVTVEISGLPDIPSGFSASSTSTQITLNWDNVAEATDYELQWASSSDGPWTRLGLAGKTATTYPDDRASAGETYWYRIRARNGSGDSPWSPTISAALDLTPYVTTRLASSVGNRSATLNSLVNPRGVSALVYFEYGTSTSYGNVTTPVATGLGVTEQSYSASVSGLAENTTYHFRVTSVNVVGQVAHGLDLTFTTGEESQAPIAIIAGNLTPVTGITTFYGGYSTGTGLRFSWSTSDGQRSTAVNPQFSFYSPRTYTIFLTVIDSKEQSSTATLEINVQAGNNGIGAQAPKGADPVVLSTGNYIQENTDLRLPGKGFPFEFTRFYNSKSGVLGDAPLGYGWTHRYNERIYDFTNTVLVTRGDGSTWTFYPTNGGYTGEPGVFDRLARAIDGSWLLTSKAQFVSRFDSEGSLTSVTDRNGNQLTLTYVEGRLREIQDTAGRTITFNSDADSFGCISTITDPIGRNIRFRYDSNTNLVAVIDANGHTNRYHYNALHQMTDAFDAQGARFVHNEYNTNTLAVDRQRDALGEWTYFVFDFTNRVTYQTNALGGVSRYAFDERLLVTNIVDESGFEQQIAYDTNRNRIVVQDKNGNRTHYGYDDRGNLLRTTNTLGYVTTLEYNSLNDPVRLIDALTNIATFGYDGRGNLTNTTNALGHVTRTQYDADGLPELVTDGRGTTKTNRHDSHGNLIEIIDAHGFSESFVYDGAGRPLRRLDQLRRETATVYDNNDNVLFVTNALGLVDSYTYDPNDNQITARNPNAALILRVFDAKGRITRTIDPLGFTNMINYDALDRKVSVVDPLGHSTGYGYDGVGNLVSITNALNEVTRFTYDANGNQTSVVDPTLYVVTNFFDALNRKTAVASTFVSTNFTAYDALNRISATTNGNGQVRQFAYDAIGQLTNVIDGLIGQTSFTYDANGNRVSTTNPNRYTWTNIFDRLNRPVELQNPNGTKTALKYDPVGNVTNKLTPNGDTIAYRLDALNRTISVHYPTGPPVAFAYDPVGNRTNMTDGLGVTVWRYDKGNRLMAVADPFGQQILYAYDGNGNCTTIVYPGDLPVDYAFDALNRLSSFTNWLGDVTSYSYNLQGNLLSTTNANGTAAKYFYDVSGRMVGLTNYGVAGQLIAAYDLTLDGLGNPRQLSSDQPLEPLISGGTNIYTYDSDNQLASINGQAVTHNLNGALTSQGSTAHAYDFEDRLISSSDSTGTNTVAYDGLGNRLSIKKLDQVVNLALDRAGSLTKVIFEYDTNGTSAAYYVYGLGLSQRITSDGQVTTYSFDIRGSTIALTDESGNITDAYAYDSFGVLANIDGNHPQPFRYLGKHGIVDDGNGLYYARARYYSPQLGRFLTKDPLLGRDEDGQSLNRYAYAQNNPLALIDISGLSPHEGIQSGYDPNIAEAAYWDAYYESAKWMVPFLTGLKYAGEGAEFALNFVSAGQTGIGLRVAGKFTIKLAAIPKAAESKTAIGATGKIGEKFLKSLGGESQKSFPTSYGWRYVDQYVQGVAHESKVGYQSLTAGIKRQIAKDVDLVESGQLKSAVWHFFESPITGLKGPSKPLLQELERNGIRVIIHP